MPSPMYASGMVPPVLTVAAVVIAAPRLVLALVIAFGNRERREHALRGLRILSARGRSDKKVTNR
jgi:hypothetical protein